MIEIKHLRKQFGEITPLKDVNLKINKGDVISIIGPSGTGKSTLLKCINYLEVPTSGEILFEGKSLSEKNAYLTEVRKKVGMVFQSFNLFSHKTVIENVMMGPVDLKGVSKEDAYKNGVKYLKAVGLAEKLYSYPDELSGGQKQRVAIARCLNMSPEVILFDEPTSALDPTMVGEVQGVIRKLASASHTMMIVTHDLTFAREVANRVIFMQDGVVVEDGSPEKIFGNPDNEKTRAFVKHLRTYEYHIKSADFDFYKLFSGVYDFGKNQFLSEKEINNIQVVIEEIVINNIIKKTQKIDIQVDYFRADEKLEIEFIYEGEEFNPFETNEEDVLSMLIVRQLTENYSYMYKEKNILKVEIKNKNKMEELL